MHEQTICEMRALVVKTKRLRAEAFAILREMNRKDLEKLEPVKGISNIFRKLHNYPGDLSITRLANLLERKEELKLP